MRDVDEANELLHLRIAGGGGAEARRSSCHRHFVKAAAAADALAATPEGRAESGTAHRMFDRGLISRADDLEILVSRQVNDQEGVRAMINRTGRAPAPQRVSERPHPGFLQWHREHRFKQ